MDEGGYLEEMGMAPALRRISSWTGVHWRGKMMLVKIWTVRGFIYYKWHRYRI